MELSADFHAQDLVMQVANRRSFSPEELGARLANQIIFVGDKSHEAVRAQAIAFKQQIQALATQAMHEMVESERGSIAHKLRAAGHPELVSLLRN